MNEREFNAGSTASETERPQPDGAAPGKTTGAGDPGEWQRLKQQSGELLEYLEYYLHARADGLKLTGRKLLFHLELEIVMLLAIASTVVVAIGLVGIGLALGLAQLLPNQQWLGPLGAGLLLLGGVGGGGWWWRRAREKQSYKETVEKYEQRKQQQQARFGHDVAERAQAARPDH